MKSFGPFFFKSHRRKRCREYIFIFFNIFTWHVTCVIDFLFSSNVDLIFNMWKHMKLHEMCVIHLWDPNVPPNFQIVIVDTMNTVGKIRRVTCAILLKDALKIHFNVILPFMLHLKEAKDTRWPTLQSYPASYHLPQTLTDKKMSLPEENWPNRGWWRGKAWKSSVKKDFVEVQ